MEIDQNVGQTINIAWQSGMNYEVFQNAWPNLGETI